MTDHGKVIGRVGVARVVRYEPKRDVPYRARRFG